jgi:prevent-host-death family protein
LPSQLAHHGIDPDYLEAITGISLRKLLTFCFVQWENVVIILHGRRSMKRVVFREANIHFAKYIQMVKGGIAIMLTDRGKPIAVISPVARREEAVEKCLQVLEEKGILTRAAAEKPRRRKLVTLRRRKLSEIVSENWEARI